MYWGRYLCYYALNSKSPNNLYQQIYNVYPWLTNPVCNKQTFSVCGLKGQVFDGRTLEEVLDELVVQVDAVPPI